MISTAITAGMLTALGFAIIAMKFGNNFVRRLLHYGWAVDVALTLGFMWLFAISGTISGMMTGIVAGIIISLMLWVAKKIYGSQKLVMDNGKIYWEDQEGEWKNSFRKIVSYDPFVPTAGSP